MSTQNKLIINRTGFLLKGIGVATFGLVALCYPGEAINALLFPFGVLVAINGLATILRNIRYITHLHHWGQTLFKKGTVELLIGLSAVASVAIPSPPFWELIALWTILTGSVHVADFYKLRDRLPHWQVIVGAGISSVLFGLFIAINSVIDLVLITYEVAAFALLLGSSMFYAYAQLSEMRQYLGNRPKKIYSTETASAW